MRTHILLTAILGLAVSGCGTCQPALETCETTGDQKPLEQFTSDCIPYAVIQTNDDGSFMIRYQTVELVPRQRTFIDANGQEIVCTEMQRSYVEHTSTVAPGTDISEYLKVRAGGATLDQQDLHFDEYVDPAPAPPAPADAVILPELQVVTSIAASQSMGWALE
ncbi:MAG: hypothetical protein U0996_22030 [Planctomycetaceae bacterium]